MELPSGWPYFTYYWEEKIVRLLIKNGRVIDPASKTDDTLDILIEKGKILSVKPRIKDNTAKTIDAARKVVAPGFIDMHVHLREPGFEHKETIKTGSEAAAQGGFTSVACMPNTSPVNDNRGVTEFIISIAKRNASVNVFPIAAITKGSQGKEITDMSDLSDAGAIAFSDDGEPVSDSQVMRRAMEYAKISDLLIIDHCEDKSLSQDGIMNEGYYSYMLGLTGIPSASETVMIARDITLAEDLNSRIHIAHLSTKGGVALLKNAKKKNLKISAEVTPHHLFLTDEALKSLNPNLKVSPPLRSKEDVLSLLSAVKDGTIDVLATDHAPHSPDEKDTELDKAPFGMIGLETAVPLFLDKLVNTGTLSLQRFITMISLNPAKILNLSNKGKISVGFDADITILNLNKKITVDMDNFKSKSRNSPFHGWTLKGVPEWTIVGGKIVNKP
jgi:dihydroorotase